MLCPKYIVKLDSCRPASIQVAPVLELFCSDGQKEEASTMAQLGLAKNVSPVSPRHFLLLVFMPSERSFEQRTEKMTKLLSHLIPAHFTQTPRTLIMRNRKTRLGALTPRTLSQAVAIVPSIPPRLAFTQDNHFIFSAGVGTWSIQVITGSEIYLS